MKTVKLIDLENDGKLNMAVDGVYLYIRCKNDIHKYDLTDTGLETKNTVFGKDGRARGLTVFGDKIFLYDFLDLYILDKGNLQVLDKIRLGTNLSSDVCGAMWFDPPNVFVKIRNGWIYDLNIETRETIKHAVSDSSFWAHCVIENKVYAGNFAGELIEFDKNGLQVKRKMQLCRKNIYDIIFHDGLLYSVSQDATLKAVDPESLGIVHDIKKAVRGMASILGIHGTNLILYDWGQIAVWDMQKMRLIEKFDFPNGSNGGAVLFAGGILYGGDYHSLYCRDFNAS